MVFGVIGAGNMAQAIIAGIVKSESISGNDIIISNHNMAKAACQADCPHRRGHKYG